MTIGQVVEDLITQAALPEGGPSTQPTGFIDSAVAADIKHLLCLTLLTGEHLSFRFACGGFAHGVDPPAIHEEVRRQMAQINNLARDMARRELTKQPQS